jgi:hypothetical protein
MAKRLEKQLAESGFPGVDAQHFQEVLVDFFHGMFRNQTVAWMLIHGNERDRFIKAVRNRMGEPSLPDYLILGTLLNLRKAARLPRTR